MHYYSSWYFAICDSYELAIDETTKYNYTSDQFSQKLRNLVWRLRGKCKQLRSRSGASLRASGMYINCLKARKIYSLKQFCSRRHVIKTACICPALFPLTSSTSVAHAKYFIHFRFRLETDTMLFVKLLIECQTAWFRMARQVTRLVIRIQIVCLCCFARVRRLLFHRRTRINATQKIVQSQLRSRLFKGGA